MREATCPSGITVKLRKPSGPLVRLIQPNRLYNEVVNFQEKKEVGTLAEDEALELERKMEKIFALIVAEPQIYVAKNMDDPIPPGHIASYEFTDEDIGYIVGQWIAPYAQKVDELVDDAAPFSGNVTPPGE